MSMICWLWWFKMQGEGETNHYHPKTFRRVTISERYSMKSQINEKQK